MKRLTHALIVAALAAGALPIAGGTASAVSLYAAGTTLPFGLYRAPTGSTNAWFDTFAGVAFRSVNGDCNPALVNCIAYASLGSGAGLTAFLAQQSPNAAPPAPTGTLGDYRNNFIPYNVGTNGYGTGPAFFDFAGSDAVLTSAQLTTYATNVQPTRGPGIQVPAVGTAVAIAFNPAGLSIQHGGRLWLSRRAYCGIFTGQITNWNHPVLTADNAGVPLTPGKAITVFRRADSSGTTFLLSRHLAAVCNGGADLTTGHPAGNLGLWTSTSVGTTVTWPASFLSATGSHGVAAAVAAGEGRITYVSPDYTTQVAFPAVSPAPITANLQNNFDYINGGPISGDTPRPPTVTNIQTGVASFVTNLPATDTQAAWGAAADTALMRNPTGPSAYPITGFTLFNFYGCYAAAKVTPLKNFVAAYTAGGPYDTQAVAAGFGPLALPIKARIRTWAATITTCP